MCKRIAVYLIGLALNALGIAIIIHSAVGAGSWDAVAIGAQHYLGLTIGICSIIIQILVVFTTKIIERKRLQYGAIITIMIRSMFLDAWTYLVFNHFSSPASWEMQWLYFLLGTLSVGVGIGIYIEAHFPKSPIDGLMMAFHHRFHWSINFSRIVCEGAGVLFGLILGGPVGLGTIIIALGVGRVIQYVNSKVKKILNTGGWAKPMPSRLLSK
ncbi:MAG: YitT family protein [Bacillota bacterium]|nr:YitT family protein [Bacillota bacterium]